jgi:hypothetical protein
MAAKESHIETKCATPLLDEIDRRIFALALIQGPKRTDQEFAEELGVSRRTVSRKRNSKPVQTFVKETLSIPADEVRRLVVKGLQRIEAHLDSEDPRVSLAAAIQLTKIGESLIVGLVKPEVEEWEMIWD